MNDTYKARYKFLRCFFADLVAVILLGFTTSSDAEVIVTGTASSLELRANGETIEKALRALSTTFNFEYHTQQPLTLRLQKTYKGSLEEVVSEMLYDYNYLTYAPADNLEVWIVGLGNTMPFKTQNQASKIQTPAPLEPTDKSPVPTDKPDNQDSRRHVADGWHHQ